MSKKCRECQEEKEFDKFCLDKRIKSGFSNLCKECENYRKRKYKEGNLHKVRDTHKKYRERKLDKDPNFYKNRYIKFKDKILAGHERYYKTHRKQKNARTIVNLDILKGKIEKPNECSKCCKKAKRIEAHHENYDKPREIIWLCTKCHSIADRK